MAEEDNSHILNALNIPVSKLPGYFFAPIFRIFKNYIVLLDNYNLAIAAIYFLVKKFLAISLLTLHLFSLYGHMALYQYFVYHSDKIFNEQISMNKYAVDDLVSVKVPVNMPTIDNWKDYAYISGQIQFKNNSYNYVKIKMTRDTIYLMCIPNYKKTRLINKNIIDARKIADIPVGKKEHVPFGKAISLSDFNYQNIQYSFIAPVCVLKTSISNVKADLIKCSVASPVQPPELLHILS